MRATDSLLGSDRAGLVTDTELDVHADLYLRDGAAVSVVLWRGREQQPFLCVKDSGSGGLSEFTVVTNDDIPPHTLRKTYLHGQVEVYRRDSELVAIALAATGQAQHPFLVLSGMEVPLEPDAGPEPGRRKSASPSKPLDGRLEHHARGHGAGRGRYVVRTYNAWGGGRCDQHFETLRSALERFVRVPGERDPCLLEEDQVVLWLDLEAGLAPVFVGPNARTVEAAYYAAEQELPPPRLVLASISPADFLTEQGDPCAPSEPERAEDRVLQSESAAVTPNEDDGPDARLAF